jgi:hypothetical protein
MENIVLAVLLIEILHWTGSWTWILCNAALWNLSLFLLMDERKVIYGLFKSMKIYVEKSIGLRWWDKLDIC